MRFNLESDDFVYQVLEHFYCDLYETLYGEVDWDFHTLIIDYPKIRISPKARALLKHCAEYNTFDDKEAKRKMRGVYRIPRPLADATEDYQIEIESGGLRLRYDHTT